MHRKLHVGLALTAVPAITAHGTLVSPPPRNALDRFLPEARQDL